MDEESECFVSNKKKEKKEDLKEETDKEVPILVEVKCHEEKEEKNKDLEVHKRVHLLHLLEVQIEEELDSRNEEPLLESSEYKLEEDTLEKSDGIQPGEEFQNPSKFYRDEDFKNKRSS